jgi:hypothetical protein
LWVLVATLLTMLALTFPHASVRAAQEYGTIATRLVKIISLDDGGERIGFPNQVLFDPVYAETYISNGKRITIYDKYFFPQGSIGPGRGVNSLKGMGLDPQGRLYLSQGGSGAFRPTITIFDQALFVDREIVLDENPNLIGFQPGSLDVAADGTIYVTGFFPMRLEDQYQGVLVLDRQGHFKKWLAPTGSVLRKGEKTAQPVGPSVAEAPAEDPDVLAFRPAPVDASFVTIDQDGRIYILSTETSQIYVYDQQERFLFTFGEKGGSKGKMSTPRALGIDYARRIIYCVDFMRHTILAYDYDYGKFLYEFGGKGVSPLWYQHPESLAVDSDGHVLIADLFNYRVQVVDPTNPARPILDPILPQGVAVAPPAAAAPPAVPEWPGPLAGLAAPVRMASSPLPATIPPAPVLEIGARFRKKGFLMAPAPLPAIGIAPVPLPVAPTVPSPVLAAVPLETAAGRAKSGAPASGLRTLVGVYGPVAAMVGVGIWLLRRAK